jgi:hypothetical protein
MNNNEHLNNEIDDDDLGIEIPKITTTEQGQIISVLEDTFLVRLDSIAQFGENAIDIKEVEKFLKKFPKHKDKIDKILAKAKTNKPKNY